MAHSSGKVAHVRQGFSWPAFVLGPLWAIAKRLWLHFVLLAVALIPLNFVSAYAENARNPALSLVGFLLHLAYMVVCGYFGNRWLKATLLKRGYEILPDDEEGD